MTAVGHCLNKKKTRRKMLQTHITWEELTSELSLVHYLTYISERIWR